MANIIKFPGKYRNRFVLTGMQRCRCGGEQFELRNTCTGNTFWVRESVAKAVREATENE